MPYIGSYPLGTSLPNTITAGSIAANAVTALTVADNAITTGDIVDGAITSAKIATGAVVTEDIADYNVTSSKLNNNITIANLTVSGSYFESANVTASGVTANITLHASLYGFTYFTASATANANVNLTGISNLPTGQATTFVLALTNGATAYRLNTITVEGNATSRSSANMIAWLGGTAPTSGNASNVDVYTFTTIKSGTSTYTVLASQAQFG